MSMTHHFLILKFLPLPRLLTHPPYRRGELLLGVLSTSEHIEFLWVLLCRFAFFPHSSKPFVEYLPLARPLAIGWPYALGTILLASLYQSMGKYVSEIPYQRVGGALSFVQIWLFAYFPELSGADSFLSMSLDLSVAQSIRIISSPSFFFSFLSLVDTSLSQLYLKPDTISSPTWQQILNSSTPYLLDFKYSSAFLSTVCRVLISGGCYTFSPQLSSSSIVFLPFLWACQFIFTHFIPSFPSLPSGPPMIALVEQLIQSYQTPTCGLKTIMLSNVESFST